MTDRALLRRLYRAAITAGAAALAATILIAVFAADFGASMRHFFLGPFLSRYAFGNMIAFAVPLLIAGVGTGIAFGSRNFNLGGEGQLYAGGFAAATACLAMEGAPPAVAQMLAALAAMLVAGAVGAFSGILKRRVAADELLTTFLVSAIVSLVVDSLITGPFQDPESNFQTTRAIPAAFRFARIFPPSSLGTGLFLALAVAAAAAFAIHRTKFGFELRTVGANPEFARYCGMDTGRYALYPMALSGALHGLAGFAAVMGTQYKAMRGFGAGLGWSAISVALIAGNRPLAAIPAALFLAYLDSGAKAAMVGSDVSYEMVAVVQAVIFYAVTARPGRNDRG